MVGACVLGMVAAVLLGIVLAGAVVVGTSTGAVVVGAGTDDDVDVVDVAGARVAGGADLSAPPTTAPTEVLPSGRGRLPTDPVRPEEDAGFLPRRDGSGRPRCYRAAGTVTSARERCTTCWNLRA